jgi:hypothetical protein
MQDSTNRNMYHVIKGTDDRVVSYNNYTSSILSLRKMFDDYCEFSLYEISEEEAIRFYGHITYKNWFWVEEWDDKINLVNSILFIHEDLLREADEDFLNKLGTGNIKNLYDTCVKTITRKESLDSLLNED